MLEGNQQPSRLQQLMQQGQATYEQTPTLSTARTRFLDAREAVEKEEAELAWLQRSHQDAYIPEAHNRLNAARGALQDATHILRQSQQVGHAKELKEQAEARLVEQAAKEKAAKVAYAQQAEADTKEAARGRFIQAGGTDAQFNHAWPDLWQAELRRRMEVESNPQLSKLRARYGARYNF